MEQKEHVPTRSERKPIEEILDKLTEEVKKYGYGVFWDEPTEAHAAPVNSKGIMLAPHYPSEDCTCKPVLIVTQPIKVYRHNKTEGEF